MLVLVLTRFTVCSRLYMSFAAIICFAFGDPSVFILDYLKIGCLCYIS